VTTLKRISLLLALGACLAAAGCGSSDNKGAPIPADAANQLDRRLTEAENRLAEGSVGACEDVLNDTRPGVEQILSSLPRKVDPDVRDALQQSFENLWSLVDRECANKSGDQPTKSTPTTTPETTPTETQTETTPTTPTDTTPTDTTPTDTTPGDTPLPPEGDGNNGGAIPPASGGNGGGVGPGAAKQKKEKGA
jgi:hypothetical protein